MSGSTIFHIVVPDPSSTRLLLIERDGVWGLPRIASDEPWAVIASVHHQVEAQFGLDIALLRRVPIPGDEMDGKAEREFWFAEDLSTHDVSSDGWCSEEALGERRMDEPDRDAAVMWFEERRSGPPSRVQPWQRGGWFARARSWIEATLPDVERVAPYRSWSGSCILRIWGDGRRRYFKATSDHARREPVLTSDLAERFPDVVPTPVAIDPERGWMVLDDFGDATMGEGGPEEQGRSLDVLLSVQRRSVPMVGELLRSGFPDRRPAVLATRIEKLVEGGFGALPAGYQRRLRAVLPRFQDLCGELADAPLPSCLVHGDFHPGNVAIQDGRLLIFDWDGACVAHPFLDLPTFFYVHASPEGSLRTRLRDRYLSGWSDLLSPRALAALFERTEPVTLMHHAIAYQEILEAIDTSQRDEWESHLPVWLDRALGKVEL